TRSGCRARSGSPGGSACSLPVCSAGARRASTRSPPTSSPPPASGRAPWAERSGRGPVFRRRSCVLYAGLVPLGVRRVGRWAVRRRVLGALLAGCMATGLAGAAPEPETIGKVATLPEQPGPHWFWLSDIILHRTALFDGGNGELLGQITSGTSGVGFAILPLFSPDHRRIYPSETYYRRGGRAEE